MKHGLQSILLLASLTLLVSGCDFFRTLAGRPTSDELAAIINAKEKAAAEAVAKASEAQAAPDTLAAADTVAAVPAVADQPPVAAQAPAAPAVQPAAEPAPAAGKPRPSKILSLKYYIVVGTFSSDENARKLVSKAEAKGFPAAVFPFRGMSGVAVCGTDYHEEIKASLAKVRESGIFPKESWIFVNK